MKSAKALFLALLLAACGSTPVPSTPEISKESPVPPIQEQEATPEDTPAPTSTLVPTSTPEPVIQRTNWLILGGDYRAHRTGTGYGNKTDVIVLVSVLESDPMDIAVVQFPRNLYVPIEGMEDQWLFAVWGREGWQGLHQYFQHAFGISLQGIHYINMDSFEQVVDDVGGVNIGHRPMSGAETLAYLRDNENNWELGSYDAGQRVFKVLAGLWVRGGNFLLEDPVAAANIVYSRWGAFFQTDLANIEQLYWLFTLGWKVKSSDYEIRWIQLEEPYIVRGDTPIVQNEQPVRGMIGAVDLEDWMQDCVLDQICEADL